MLESSKLMLIFALNLIVYLLTGALLGLVISVVVSIPPLQNLAYAVLRKYMTQGATSE